MVQIKSYAFLNLIFIGGHRRNLMQVFDKRWMDSLKQEFMVNIFLISAVFYWKDIIQPSNTFVILLFNFFINFCRMSMFKRYIVNHSKIKQPSWKHKNISLSVCVYIVSKYHNVFFKYYNFENNFHTFSCRSVSFIMVTACFAFILLSFLYLIIDVAKIWDGTPFIFPGICSF